MSPSDCLQGCTLAAVARVDLLHAKCLSLDVMRRRWSQLTNAMTTLGKGTP